jgi:heptosyltransferase I
MSRLPLSKAPESICVLRLSAIGDVTHVLPTIRSIQHKWPETKISWIIGKTEAQLVDAIPEIEFFVFDKAAGLGAFRQLRRQLKGRQFDVLLHMQISFRANLASMLVRAPIRLGFDRARLKNLHNLFVNHHIRVPTHRQHVLDSFLGFAHALGITEDVIEWGLPRAKDYENIRANFSQGKYMVINPCTSSRIRNYRNWSIENYARLIDFIVEDYDLPVILTGGPDKKEIQYGEAIYNMARHKPVNMIGRTSLRQLTAVMSNAELVIAPDTGPLHIANACGTQVIGLYASSNPMRTGPYNFLDDVINAYPQALLQDTGKSVEENPWGRRVRQANVMALITLDDVIEKFKQVYRPG